MMIGYPSTTKGYRILMNINPIKIIDTMHVTFSESLDFNPNQLLSLPDRAANHFFIDEIPLPIVENVPININNDNDFEFTNDDVHLIVPPPLIPPVRTANVTPRNIIPLERDPYPSRTRTDVPNYFAKAVRYSKATQRDLPSKVLFRKIVSDPMLRDSMTQAVNDLYECGAIELVPLLPSDKPVKTIWVHQEKKDNDGVLIKIKSRVCPQGFRFRPGTDFDPDEVSSSTPHVQTLMLGLSIEVQRNLFTEHLDAVNCFQRESNLPLDSRITIKPTDGFFVPEGMVIRMINALQGSPQAGRIWEDKANIKLITWESFQQWQNFVS
jgi:hypothetical protein